MEIKDLYDAASAMGNSHSLLKDTINALELLEDGLSWEGLQRGGVTDNSRAIAFVERFPMYLGALSCVIHNLHQIDTELDERIDEIYIASGCIDDSGDEGAVS